MARIGRWRRLVAAVAVSAMAACGGGGGSDSAERFVTAYTPEFAISPAESRLDLAAGQTAFAIWQKAFADAFGLTPNEFYRDFETYRATR